MGHSTRNRLVVISGLGGLAMACGGSIPGLQAPEPPCPATINTGDACAVEAQSCTEDLSSDPCDVRIHQCTDGAWERVIFPCNPPPPDTGTAANSSQPPENGGPAAAVCPVAFVEGEACPAEGLECLLPGQEDGCGINGYACEEGVWTAVVTFCNPPPPPQ